MRSYSVKSLYEHIDLAKKFGDGKVGIVESVTAQEPDKTTVALDVAKHLQATKEQEQTSQLRAMPIPN